MNAKRKKQVLDFLMHWVERGKNEVIELIFEDQMIESQSAYYEELIEGVRDMVEAIEDSLYFEAKRRKEKKVQK